MGWGFRELGVTDKLVEGELVGARGGGCVRNIVSTVRQRATFHGLCASVTNTVSVPMSWSEMTARFAEGPTDSD